MKSLLTVFIGCAALLAVSFGATVHYARRSSALQTKLTETQTALVSATATAEIYRTRAAALQERNDMLLRQTAAETAALNRAAAENHDWANAELPAGVAAALKELPR